MLTFTAVLLLGAVLATGMGAVRIEPAQVVAILAKRIGVPLPVAYTPQQDSVL